MCHSDRLCSSSPWKADVQELRGRSEQLRAGFWALWELSSFSHKNRTTRVSTKWGRGRQEFCDFRMSQLQMGEEKAPAEGVGSFQAFIAPSWKDTSTRLVTAQSWLCHHRVNFKTPKGGHSAAGGKSLLSSLWDPDDH